MTYANTQSIIDALPDNAKTPVLMSLVGLLNSNIINNAQSVVMRLTRDGVEMQDYNVRDVEHLMTEPDWRQDNLMNVRRAMSVRENLRDQLLALTNDDKIGDIMESIMYRTKPRPVAEVDAASVKAVLIASRVVKANVSDADIALHIKGANIRQTENNVRSAERTANMVGAIEWVIDHVFNPDTGFEQQDNVEDLARPIRATMFAAVVSNIDKQRRVLMDELIYPRKSGTGRYTLNDAPLLADCADRADELDAHLEESTID